MGFGMGIIFFFLFRMPNTLNGAQYCERERGGEAQWNGKNVPTIYDGTVAIDK